MYKYLILQWLHIGCPFRKKNHVKIISVSVKKQTRFVLRVEFINACYII